MPAGVVDIGSNTIKVMVGGIDQEDEFFTKFEKTLPVRLGAGTFETGFIPEEKIRAGVKAISELLADARYNGAESTCVVATSAVRSAVNAAEFLGRVQETCDTTVKILSGDEEATMIFRGVNTDKFLRDKRIWVVDVGGGSVEFILGVSGNIEKKVSLELGAVRVSSLFCNVYPAREDTAKKMMLFLSEKFRHALHDWDTKDAMAVATGGSALCIARWKGQRSNRKVSKDMLETVINEVWPKNLDELNSDPRIPKGRGEVLLAGAATYLSALESIGKDEFYVSDRNLRYGVLVELICGGLCKK